jgi:RHH-type transcriptional regulator, rel operon repressor / antitoxin RelB
MLSTRLDPEIERRLSELAKRTGRTKTYYVRELIEGNIEDLEDRYLPEARLEKRGSTLTSRQVRKELGLDHRIRLSSPEGPQEARPIQLRHRRFRVCAIAGSGISFNHAITRSTNHSISLLRDYRIIREFEENRLVVLVVAVGHRSTIYSD